MIPLFAVSVAWAAEPVPLPEVALAEIGLAAPTRVEGTVPQLRYPLLGRAGFVSVLRFDDVAGAESGFDGLYRTAATHWPAPVTPTTSVDRFAGDGAAIQLVRVGTTVILVRDSAGQAGALADAVLAASSGNR